MRKFRLKNLTCANCAAKIERNLAALASVRSVTVNFAAATLWIDADDVREVRGVVSRVEPDVEMVELSGGGGDEGGGDAGREARKDAALIIAAAALFALGFFVRRAFCGTSYAAAEYAVFLTAYLLAGGRVLLSAARNIFRGKVFDENSLMTIATVGAIAIHELPEAVGVMLFFRVGEFFQDLSVRRSRRSIKSLLEVRPDYAHVRRDGELVKVSPQEVKVGDVVVVKPGEKVPLDGEVREGTSQLDTSALTGEPVPRVTRVGETVLAGMINKTGVLAVEVSKPFGESSVAKILALVENAAGKKAATEKFITKFAAYYTPAVVAAALGVALVPPLVLPGATFSTWVYRALVLLVISCPCALVISIPLGYFGGVGGASRRGILVKGSNFLDVLSALKTVVFDKTGTLTEGDFRVTEVVAANGFTREGLLAVAARAECHSNHPIAQSILAAYGKKVDAAAVRDYEEVAGKGIRAKVDGRAVVVGNDRLLHLEEVPHDTCGVVGTVVHVAVEGVYAGYIIIADEIRADAGRAVRELKALGVRKVMMLTGDGEETAACVAEELGLDAYLAQLLPEEKVAAVEKLLAAGGEERALAFVGDGINDAPVIARADVGIAMGGLGSDAAIDAADVVIMTDAPSKVAAAIRIGRKTRRIVRQNIFLALGVKGVFIALGVVGIATMWEAVFADVGVALLAVFNASRALITKE